MRNHMLVLVVAVCAGVIGSSSEANAQGNPSSARQSSSEVYFEEPGLVFSRSRLPRVKREDMDDYGKKVYDAIVSSDPSYKDGVKTGQAMWLYSPRLAEHLFRLPERQTVLRTPRTRQTWLHRRKIQFDRIREQRIRRGWRAEESLRFRVRFNEDD